MKKIDMDSRDYKKGHSAGVRYVHKAQKQGLDLKNLEMPADEARDGLNYYYGVRDGFSEVLAAIEAAGGPKPRAQKKSARSVEQVADYYLRVRESGMYGAASIRSQSRQRRR